MIFTSIPKYDIQSDLLADCIKNRGAAENKGFHYGIFCFLVCKALNIHRMNYFSDRVYGRNLDKKGEHFFRNLHDEALEDACEDLKRLYEFTQKSLNQNNGHFYSESGQVPLKRGVGRRKFHRHEKPGHYEEYIANTYRASKILGKTSMHIDMDLMNSFSASGYDCLACISLNVPCPDILYFSEIVTHRGQEIMESNEFVVVNRTTFGIVEIPTNAVCLDEGAWEHLLEKSEEKWAVSYLNNSNKFANLSKLRPISLSQCSVAQELREPKRSALYKARAVLAHWVAPK